MQFQLSAVRSKVDFDVQGELPARNIDTGMGLERMAAILQGGDNIYETDTMRKILDRAADLTDVKYGRDHPSHLSLPVIADHVRSGMMIGTHGAAPRHHGPAHV